MESEGRRSVSPASRRPNHDDATATDASEVQPVDEVEPTETEVAKEDGGREKSRPSGPDVPAVGRLTRVAVKHSGPIACCILVACIVAVIVTIGVFAQTARNLGDAFNFGEFRPLNDPVIKQADALREIRDVAYEDRSSDDDDDKEVDPNDPNRKELRRSQVAESLTLVYEALGDEDLLSPANIAKVAEVERAVLETDWKDYCFLVYDEDDENPRCGSPRTILNYLYRNDRLHKKQCEDGYCLFSTYDSVCGSLVEWGTPPCISRVYDWRDGELAEPKKWLGLIEDNLCDNDSAEFDAKYILDREAYECEVEEEGYRAQFLRSSYSIGWPLQGYRNTDDRDSDQRAQFIGGPFTDPEIYGNRRRRALRETIDPLSYTNAEARTYRNASTTPSGFTMNIMYEDQASGRFAEIGLVDNFLGISSLIFVFCYIWANVGSFFLAVTGAAEIILSLPLALFFWRIVLQQVKLEFLFFNSLFLILCIGADDIFVYMDNWKASLSQPPEISGSLETRLSWTYKKAASAMAVTTSTTCLCLITTAFSSIPALRSFGIFAALVVLFDYLLVISWFPLTVLFYTKRLERNKWCNPCALCCKCCRPEEAPAPGEAAPRRKVVAVLADKVAPWMYAKRWFLLAFAAVVTVVMAIVLGTQFELATNLPTFVVPTHPLSVLSDVQREEFFRAADEKYQVQIVYGVNSSDALEYTNSGQLTPTEDDERRVNYADNFTLDEDLQVRIYKDCRRAKKRLGDLVSEGQVYCLLNDLEQQSLGFPFKTESDLRFALERFYKSQLYESRVRSFPDYDRLTGFVPEGDNGVRALWNSFNTTIPLETGPGPTVLQPYFDDWEAYSNTCSFDCYHMLLRSRFRGAEYEIFIILKTLTRETLITVVASLVAAYVVLFLASGNMIVSALVVLTVMCAIVSMLACIFLSGFPLGLLESVLTVLVIGLSIDYAVHISHFYVEGEGTRYDRTLYAIETIGISVVGGAATTIFAGVPLFFSIFEFNYLFGFYILFTAMWAFFMTACMLIPLLFIIGPEGKRGQVPLPWLKHGH